MDLEERRNIMYEIVAEAKEHTDISHLTICLALELLLTYLARPKQKHPLQKQWKQYISGSCLDVAIKAREHWLPETSSSLSGEFMRTCFLPVIAPRLCTPTSYDLYLASTPLENLETQKETFRSYIGFLTGTRQWDPFLLFRQHWPFLSLKTCFFKAYRGETSLRSMFQWWESIPKWFREKSLRGVPLKGEGSFGSVHVVENAVIKTFSEADVPEYSFLRELGNMIVLYAGPGVHLQAVGFGKVAQLQMDYGGTDLVDWIDKKEESFTGEQVRPFLKDWISELEYAHQRGLSHRDLSYNNVLITDDLKHGHLCDWGAGRFAQRERETMTSVHDVCTDEFLPPESVVGYPATLEQGQKADIWALGCNLLFLTDTALFERVFCEWSFTKVCTLLGPPTRTNSGDVYNYFIKKYDEFPEQKEEIQHLKSLILQMLIYDPMQRVNCEKLLFSL
jgi:hypothetical protein